MTPRSDSEEDMSMEEILASIRKFVTDNPPEDPHKQRVYKGDLAGAVVIPPAGHASMEHQRNESIPSPIDFEPSRSAPVYDPNYQAQYQESQIHKHTQPNSTQGFPKGSVYEPDILELNTPLSQSSQHQHPSSQRKATPEHHAPWTPPSRTPFQKKTLEESIMTLTNPIDSPESSRPEKLRASTRLSATGELDGSLVSTQAIAASASSLTRLAHASKSVPKKPNLADQRNVTLDQLIQDLIRPMIKQWIDTHLPSLVEEMVAKEIKRITKHLE
jgi:uncharacterized protein